jgi:hypothetical protein
MQRWNTVSERECPQETEEKYWLAAVLRAERSFHTDFFNFAGDKILILHACVKGMVS